MIYKYGEERKSRQIAARIAERRRIKPIETTKELAEIIYTVIHKTPNAIDPATRTFQALRIAVNNELEELENGLKGAVDLLTSHGRLVVVTFHSLEDRIVKSFSKNKAAKRRRIALYAGNAAEQRLRQPGRMFKSRSARPRRDRNQQTSPLGKTALRRQKVKP